MSTEHDPSRPADLLPHGAGFRYVSCVTRLTPGQDGDGLWRLTGNEPFFADHFPRQPLVPGVLMIEALAQMAGIVCYHRQDQDQDQAPPQPAMLAQVQVKILSPIAPPADIRLQATVARHLGPLTRVEVKASVGGLPAVTGQLTLANPAGGVPPTPQ